MLDLGHTSTATWVLINWARPWNIPKIISAVCKYPFVNEVIVWDNSGKLNIPGWEAIPEFENDHSTSVKIIRSDKNVHTYGRFLAAEQAKNDNIVTCDDDVIPLHMEWLYKTYCRTRTPTAFVSEGSYLNEQYRPWLQLGWGSCFTKDSVRVLDKWVAKYGYDELLYRKADRIFTTLCGMDRNMYHGSYERLKNPNGGLSENDESSLWHRSDHVELTQQAVEKALELKDETTTTLSLYAPVGS